MQRSTGKASKLRRDQINLEIETLRQLLPLPAAVKVRLSYLQVMSLVCSYIRTGNFFSSYAKAWMVGNGSDVETARLSDQPSVLATVEITQALPGFLLLIRPSGKILHVSENVIDHLGHSMIEILSGGGDVYDLVDGGDHVTLQTHLETASDKSTCSLRSSRHSFVCHMIMSRSLRRRTPFQGTECKAFHIDGRFHYCEGNGETGGGEGVFLALCTPADTSMDSGPSYSDNIMRYSPTSFTTKHTLDMRIVDSCNRAPLLLGYSTKELHGYAWYHLIRPEYIFVAQNFHQQILVKTGTSDTQCSSKLQLVTKDNQTITTQITARLTRQSSCPVLYTITCEYLVIRCDIGGDYLYQHTLSSAQRVDEVKIHCCDTGPWPDYKDEYEKDIKDGRHYISSALQRNSRYKNEEFSFPLPTSMLGRLPQRRYATSNVDSESSKERRSHGQASTTPIQNIKSEFTGDFPTRELCQRIDDPSTVDARFAHPPSYTKGKMKNKNYRTALPYPSVVSTRTMDSQYGGFLERLQGTLDLTYVFGQQDTYRAHGTICLLSSRCSLTEIRQRPDRGTTSFRNRTEGAKGHHPSIVTPGVSDDVFDTSSSRTYCTQLSGQKNYDEHRMYNGSGSFHQYAEPADLRWSAVDPESSVSSGTPSASVWPSNGLRSNRLLWRQHSRSAADTKSSPVEIGNFLTGESENRNERCLSRPGSFGMRSVEESVTAALKCLSNDQIKLLDQATSELSETVPCLSVLGENKTL